ncbi:MAG: oligosaccharide flippase family protein [Clostridia bacterium]|nr:oligosaccharide flippase family protein [Clostridia bacterium]
MILDKSELGNYEEAYKLINILFTVVSSLGVVMIPRIANIFSTGNYKKLNNYIKSSFEFTFFLSFPIMFGIIAISKEFVPIFLGEEYKKAILIVTSLAPIILFCGITNVIGTQYLLPTKRQKQYTISIIVGLIVNIILNLIFIKRAGAIGAAIVTIISQFIVLLIQVSYIKKQVNIKSIFASNIKYLIASFIMFVVCNLLNLLNINNRVILVILKIFVGVIIYFIFIYIYNKIIYLNIEQK